MKSFFLLSQSYHEDAKVCQVVAVTDGFVAAGFFGDVAAVSIPASGTIWW